MPMKREFTAKAKDRRAEMYLYNEIGDQEYGFISADMVAKAISSFGAIDVLDIYINSPGGSVFEGIAIYNQLARVKAKKIVHIDSLAASIASVIMCAGDEIRMASNAEVMIHEASGFAWGSKRQLRKAADAVEHVEGAIVDTYAGRTSIGRDEVVALMEAETWMRADEAKKYGFIDVIVNTSEPRNAIITPLLNKYNNTPQDLREFSRDSRLLLAKMAMHSQKYSRLSPAKT